MKVAVIGGGSTYTPELVRGFLERAVSFPLTELSLMDTAAERLATVGGFARRMALAGGAPFDVELGGDLDEAVDGAAYVITQLRVGGMAARREDEYLGQRHGLIGQETTGIGGMAKALRTIPAIMRVCGEVERQGNRAWIINFTNPSGLITEAILNHTACRCIGLCNVPIDVKMNLAKFLGVAEQEIDLDVVGLNHLGWVRRIVVQGQDVTERVLEVLASDAGPANIPDIDVKPELVRALRAAPLYYNRYYYQTERVLAEQQAKERTRAQEVMAIEEQLLAKYRDSQLVTKPDELNQRGGAYYSKIAIELIEAIACDLQREHVVNVRNQGAIPNLPADNVVETVARVGKNGAVPRPTQPLEPSIRALIQQAKAYEELTIEAALNRSYGAAYRAIITNPLGPTADRAKEVLDDLLRTNHLDYA